jgi:hypothetical protein
MGWYMEMNNACEILRTIDYVYDLVGRYLD